MSAYRLLDQEGPVLCPDAFQRRWLASEAHAERTRTLRGMAWGLGLSGALWIAIGVIWRGLRG